MRDFILFFEEKEGTSPLMRLLDGFGSISVVHHIGGKGWEPFDGHNCGPMELSALHRSLNLLFSGSRSMEELNALYMESAPRPLADIPDGGSVGFKMRFVPPPRRPAGAGAPLGAASGLSESERVGLFRQIMFQVLKEHEVTVFLAVRQDIFLWGLSKYHGDGSGVPGHIQFALATGAIQRDEIPRITVDAPKLERILSGCRASHASKRRLQSDLEAAGIRCHPLLYEEFLTDKPRYFQRLFSAIDQPFDQDEFSQVLERGGVFEKVHADDISSFVENHEEVMERFGEQFVSWTQP